MVDFYESLEIDPGLLEKRLKFLTLRAEWHGDLFDDPGSGSRGSLAMHLACAATLRRDAGTVALLLREVEIARSEFEAAGDLRLRLGFYDGLYLIRASGTGSADGREMPSDVSAWMERSLDAEHPLRGSLPQFALAARNSPNQLVSVMQAEALSKEARFNKAAALASERLRPYGEYPLGVTQVPTERYLKLAKELRNGELGGGRNTLLSMSLRREEAIAAAQRDRFHWRLARTPADLVDMDLLALGLIALESGEGLFEQVRDIAAEVSPTARIPFDIAQLLRPVDRPRYRFP